MLCCRKDELGLCKPRIAQALLRDPSNPSIVLYILYWPSVIKCHVYDALFSSICLKVNATRIHVRTEVQHTNRLARIRIRMLCENQTNHFSNRPFHSPLIFVSNKFIDSSFRSFHHLIKFPSNSFVTFYAFVMCFSLCNIFKAVDCVMRAYLIKSYS